ncbi:hypothetical protein [Algibacter lectus]|uniref:hypothetical protein n=1 Tax=Algibacter lectus TaxID=221126 RepID=UPI000943F8CD|nr:hypothetical protein [Algibacter lectus]
MKKLNLIVFTLLIFSANNVHSQEKQNDATWEETINFISENLKYTVIESLQQKFNQQSFDNEYATIANKTKHSIKDNFLNTKFSSTYNKDKSVSYVYFETPLNKLKKVTLEKAINDEFTTFNIGLKLTGKFAKRTSDDEEKFFDSILLSFDDHTLANRMTKAFQHLAYLASEKRKQSKF